MIQYRFGVWLCALLLVGCSGDTEDGSGDDTGPDTSDVWEDYDACLLVDEGTACPASADVAPEDLQSRCGAVVVEVTGEGAVTDYDDIPWYDPQKGQDLCCYPSTVTPPTCDT